MLKMQGIIYGLYRLQSTGACCRSEYTVVAPGFTEGVTMIARYMHNFSMTFLYSVY